MIRQEFETYLNTYGTDLSRWPHTLLREAHWCFQAYVEAVEEVRQLDTALDAFRVAQPTDALLEKIMAIPDAAEIRAPRHPEFLWKQAVFMAVSAWLGLWASGIGTSTSTEAGQPTATTNAVTNYYSFPTSLNEVQL